ncbi:MAG: hypothetical protein J6R18_05285 [Kiritimatiellae bacterium]|nr:hypothetical protein [Kiritimatiellia bacterium]
MKIVRRAFIATAMSAVAALAVLPARAGFDFAPKAVVSTDGFIRVVSYDDPADDMGFRRPILAFAGNLIDSISRAFDIKRVKVSDPGLIIYAMGGRTNDTRVITKPETRADGSKVVKIFLPSPGYSDLDELSFGIAKAFVGADLPDWIVQGVLRCRDGEMRRADTRFVLELWSDGRLPFFPALCTDLRKSKGKAAALPGYVVGWLREKKALAKLREEGWNGKRLAEILTGETDPVSQDRASDERLARLARSVLHPGECGKWELDFFSSRLMLYPPFFETKLVQGSSSCTFKEAIEANGSNLLVRAVAFMKSREIPLYALGRGDGLRSAADGYQRLLLGIAAGEDRKELEKMLKNADSKLEALYEKNRKDDNR